MNKITTADGTSIFYKDWGHAALATNLPQFYIDIPTGFFYGFNRPGAKISQARIENWWCRGILDGVNAHYECIKAFSETDLNEDLKRIDVLVLGAQGTDDQVMPYSDSAALSVRLT